MLSVIMAGGVGERFWPLSRRERPKQLLDLTGRGSMIGLTVARLAGLSEPEEILVITGEGQRRAVLDALRGMVPEDNVIGEPVGRNTAPCVGLAAVVARRRHGDAPMLVVPADHLIEPEEDFRRLARVGAEFVAERGGLVTFGVVPSRPETGYGYIQTGERVGEWNGVAVHRVDSFREKPDLERARGFVEAGNFLWNSGMFVWTAATILDEIAAHRPELGALLREIDAALGTRPLPEVLHSLYARCPSISIDYAVMEKAPNVVVLQAEFEWNDVGSWEAVRGVHQADAAGNVVVGDAVLVDAADSTVLSSGRMVGLVGVDNVVVVDGGDSVLVCHRDRVQDVKRVVEALRERGRDDLI